MPKVRLGFEDKTAIVRVGWTRLTRNSDVRTLTLAAEASLKAIADAGLQVQDIDGVVSYFHKRPESKEVQELTKMLGMKQCNFQL